MHTDRFRLPSDQAPDLALFIMRTYDGTHTGILHRMRGRLIIQDMLWHKMFRSAPCRRSPHFVVLHLEAEEENDVRGMCRLIHDRQNDSDQASAYRIPYAFRHGNNDRFNASNGELMLVDGLGLTCSTFVLSVFESAEVPLVRLDSWKRRAEDDARHETLLARMRNGIPEQGIPPADPEHVKQVENELPCIRIRPEEIAAAGFFDELPAKYEQLEPAGQWILAGSRPLHRPLEPIS